MVPCEGRGEGGGGPRAGIAARLDTDVHGPQCRLAFHGTVVHPLEGEEWKRLTVIKDKRKEAQVRTPTREEQKSGWLVFLSPLLKYH